MVGLVIVSHSTKIAEGICDMAYQMAGSVQKIIAAGGTADGGIGTDPVKIAAALQAADDGSGVVILADLGSAVLSADMALELIEEPLKSRVKIANAPIVEGAVVAAVQASLGSKLPEVVRTAERAHNLEKV